MDEGGNNGGGMDRRGEEKGKESDARPPISQGFVIKGGGVAFSVSVTLKVNKTNGTAVGKLHWAKPHLSEICVCALATHLKKREEKKERQEEKACGVCAALQHRVPLCRPSGGSRMTSSQREDRKSSCSVDNQDLPSDRMSAAFAPHI